MKFRMSHFIAVPLCILMIVFAVLDASGFSYAAGTRRLPLIPLAFVYFTYIQFARIANKEWFHPLQWLFYVFPGVMIVLAIGMVFKAQGQPIWSNICYALFIILMFLYSAEHIIIGCRGRGKKEEYSFSQE